MAFNKASTKEISQFRKSEIGKLGSMLRQLDKVENDNELKELTQQMQSALIKLEESTNGHLHSDWTSTEPV